MKMIRGQALLALLIVAFAAYIAVMNWLCAIVSLRNRRKGIDKHHSMVPVISLILVAVAVPIYPFTPKWWLGLIPLFDLGNLNMLRLPFFMIAERERKGTGQGSEDVRP